MGIIDYIEAKNRERVMKARVEDASKVGIGVLMGLVIGGAAGVLYAPKAGEETRKDLAKKAQETTDKVKAGAQDAIDRAAEYRDELQSKVTAIGPAIESGLSAAQKSLDDNEKSIKEKVEKVGESAGKTADDAKEAAKEVKDSAKDTAKKAGDAAKKEYKKEEDKNTK
ncbi:YtxH domain-containing protein [Kallipyga gabonensis]|uniref:YtxH domain-containing protein n=1 Tax=Kallipyga gabonensis TaxID=1686287 RepID=UPI0006B42278|nr:YtxH domain-containing protein [Kallipyga gabonensis]